MPIIETESLTKAYGSLKAVDGVSLKIGKGEVFGLLGPNGAGKTTFISMLVTMRKPSGGRAILDGHDVSKEPGEARKAIGIVFQDPTLDEELTAFENLELHAAMYGVPAGERGQRIREVIGTVELAERLHDTVKTFSGGMRRRLEIARGLLHYPKVLFLDEPTIGLDPQTRKHVWDYIRKLRTEHGITIVMTTHYMDEADSLCDRIAIMDHGRIIATGTSAELKDSLGGDIVSIETDAPGRMDKAVRGLPYVKGAKVNDSSISLSVVHGGRRIAELMEVARKSGVSVKSVSMHEPTLDDVFLHYTGRSIRPESGSAKDSMRMRHMAWAGGRRK
ncbi:MAG: ATP-binding cassette domain-containing protein [Candidatus Micrarchaeota archaeon]